MKIVFTGGGTAGHVTPNIALIEILCKQHECFYVGTNGMEKKLIEPLVESGMVKEFFTISANKLRRKLTPKTLLLPFQLLKSICQSKAYLKKLKPDVVFSKGGYVGLPVVIAAHKLKIKTICHESDISMGLANKICKKYCDHMLSTFDTIKNVKAVGAIIRQEIFSGDKQKGLLTMGFDGKKPVLLVTGGSLGAEQLNNLILKSPQLEAKFDIFVITGKNKTIDCAFAHQAQFVSNMADVLRASTVAVTRAGSNSLIELSVARVPFVTIPLMQGSRGEQLLNAKYFCDRDCGILLTGDVQAKSLVFAVNTVFDNLNFYRKNQSKLEIDGTQEVLKLIAGH